MKPKDIVLDFYKSDVFLDKKAVGDLLHPEVILDWNSSEGFIQMKYRDILFLSEEMSRAYVRSKIKVSQVIQEKNRVTVRYSHFVKTIENPREEILLAHFISIWEIKEDKLFRGYQISQL